MPLSVIHFRSSLFLQPHLQRSPAPASCTSVTSAAFDPSPMLDFKTASTIATSIVDRDTYSGTRTCLLFNNLYEYDFSILTRWRHFKRLVTALSRVLTQPDSVADVFSSDEQRFYKLKLIKTYLHSCMIA